MNQSEDDVVTRELLEGVYSRYHYDFRAYAPTSLRRRLEAARLQRGLSSLAQLRDEVLGDPAVFTGLLESLTVQLSDLFRDPEYFRAIREQVVPLLRTYPSIKLWVAGCSSGEEVYSYAILLHEAGLLERTLIYATDINPGALRKAEAGVYELSRVARFTENHQRSGAATSLADYYTAGLRQRPVREMAAR